MCSLKLQRLKLYEKLQAPKPVHEQSDCCTSDLTDEELEVLDSELQVPSNFTDEEDSALFFISGFVAKSTDPNATAVLPSDPLPESEFTELLTRGRLTFPSSQMYTFTRLCYGAFTKLSNLQNIAKCSSRTRKLFTLLLHSLPFDFAEQDKVCRKLCNTFFKGLVNQRNTALIPRAPASAASERKMRKLTSAI